MKIVITMVEDEGQGFTISEHAYSGLLDNKFAAIWHALLTVHNHT